MQFFNFATIVPTLEMVLLTYWSESPSRGLRNDPESNGETLALSYMPLLQSVVAHPTAKSKPIIQHCDGCMMMINK